MSIHTIIPNDAHHDESVASRLQDVLIKTYGLYLATHNYHWNVEGDQFASLHRLFQDQYTELITAVDDIAERIRALDHYALPFEGDDIGQTLKMTSNALNKESNANDRAERMIYNLLALHEAVIISCQIAKTVSRDCDDDESENIMVERITVHQKAAWMLRSIVK